MYFCRLSSSWGSGKGVTESKPMSRSADVTSMKVREGEWVRVGTRGGMVGRVTMLTSEFIERAFFLSSGHVAGYKSCEDWLRWCCLMQSRSSQCQIGRREYSDPSPIAAQCTCPATHVHHHSLIARLSPSLSHGLPPDLSQAVARVLHQVRSPRARRVQLGCLAAAPSRSRRAKGAQGVRQHSMG